MGSSVAATAGHAFAVLASYGEPGAARLAAPWVASELRSDPNGVVVLEDAAAVDVASGRLAAAAALLARDTRLDPTDPTVLLAAGQLDLRRGERRQAVGSSRRRPTSRRAARRSTLR